jgi:tRNA A37 threonylcarbamoyladenosine synthetase subunit TsaC/SUA5/YrdC
MQGHQLNTQCIAIPKKLAAIALVGPAQTVVANTSSNESGFPIDALSVCVWAHHER